MSSDQFFHLMKQGAGQQDIDGRYFVFGHIATYDPARNMVRVIVPSWRDEVGRPVQTPWVKLASPGVGGGFGVQIAPFGGATAQQPTAGEQVLLSIVDRQRGIFGCAQVLYTDNALPPSGQLSTPLAPGEAVVRHTSGAFMRFHANGDVEVNTTAGNVSVWGNIVNLGKQPGDVLQTLCTTAFYNWVLTHTHSGVVTGGADTAVPNGAPPADALTSIVLAE